MGIVDLPAPASHLAQQADFSRDGLSGSIAEPTMYWLEWALVGLCLITVLVLGMVH